jgi:ATP-binding cassette subfamily B protein RaxB
MVALRLGAPVRVEELRQKVVPGPQGLSLQQLCELAGEIGLTCRAVRVSVDRLGQVELPAVAHWSGGHYVVLHELTEAGVVIFDPARGIVTWKPFFLGQCYTGSLLIFD